MIPYDVIITSVHDRADLLDRTLRSMLPQLDQKPARILVNEDVRAGAPVRRGPDRGDPAAIEARTRCRSCSSAEPRHRPRARDAAAARGGLDGVRLLHPGGLRLRPPVPVARCLELMQRTR
jgi:hypothetical protein